MTEQNAIPETKAIFIYLGARQLLQAPWLCYGYLEILQDNLVAKQLPAKGDTLSRESFFSKPLVNGYQPGAVFEMPVNRLDDGHMSVWGGKLAEFRGYWPRESDVAELQAMHRATNEYATLKRTEAKAKKYDALTPHITALRKAYGRSKTSAGRAALLAWIVSQVVRGELEG